MIIINYIRKNLLCYKQVINKKMATLADIIRAEFESYSKDNGLKGDVSYLKSPLVNKYVSKITGKDSIFSVRDKDLLEQIHKSVLKDAENKKGHQHYSAAILHYRNFLALKVTFK